jgi:hypothetical protein
MEVMLLHKIKAFNLNDAAVTLWTFKKQSPKGLPPQFNGHWVDTTIEMNNELKGIVERQLNEVTEEGEYSLLAQNNEASVLTITEEETHFAILKEQIAAELPRRKVRDKRTLLNCSFYIIKISFNGDVLYAVKKADSTWKSKSALNVVTAVFTDTQLRMVSDNSFRIQRSIDFFGFDGELAVKHKGNFESILNYKAAHEKDYAEMSAEPDFSAVFGELAPLTAFVGDNKIHLRRMSAIRQKGFYADPIFMENLRNDHKKYGLNIVFDDQGRIIPTIETCRDIMSALLDHRLGSAFSGNIYDVPDAVRI